MRPRPVEHLHQVGRDYPRIWELYRAFVAGRDELGDWPPWCYCPLAAAYVVVSGGGIASPQQAADVARVGALAAWRATQGVYRFDPALSEALWETPVDGDLPTEHLERLPEWCVYVEVEREHCGGRLLGYFAHLEHDSNNHRKELRLLLDYEDHFVPAIIHLGAGLGEGVRKAIVEARIQALRAGATESAPPIDLAPTGTAIAAPLVSLLLYLCAETPELKDQAGRVDRPNKPTLRVGRTGPHYPLPKRPIEWRVGAELGQALNRVRREGGGGPSPSGHIRRAHWHTYWIGSRSEPDARKRELRWIPPVGVNLAGQQPSPRDRSVLRPDRT
ncbi:MAG: hypothetical protein OXU20_06940 [Myxococcales bacterium]|nr:hypothetical protein [Myxococcales bacterium]MDD9965618.1 hypothetical protein [Myxococcales bacterium]